MTLYRINFVGDFKLNQYTRILIENGQLEAVEWRDHEIECEACNGAGYPPRSPMPVVFKPKCERCGGAGVRTARIVIMEDR